MTSFVASPLTEAADCVLATGLETRPLASEIGCKAAVDTLVDALLTCVGERKCGGAEELSRTSKAASGAQP